MRKKLGTKNSKSNEGRQGKNGGVKADYTRERLSYARRVQNETRAANSEMGGM